MQKHRCIPQEILKLIAAITMLIDHIGASIFPDLLWIRMIGRIAFPIYCFLLAEGMRRTRNPLRYLLRLFIGIFLAELPFDLLFRGHWDWTYQSVMVTLTLGGMMLLCMQKVQNTLLRILLVVPFAWIAESAMCDYGAMGILLIAIFGLVQSFPGQLICVLFLCLAEDARYIVESLVFFQNWPLLDAVRYILTRWPPIETLAVTAMVPIGLYDRRKLTHSKALQAAFYLFYPVHLTILWVISNCLL